MVKSYERVFGRQLSADDSHNMTIKDISERLRNIDFYLKVLAKLRPKIKSDSKLIYAKDLFQMTYHIIDKQWCSEEMGNDLLLVVMVFNRVDDFNRRHAIRQTWGQEFAANSKTRLYFAVGLSSDPTIQSKLEAEDYKFGDILQFGYYESYYNCTIKAMGIIRWTARSCPFVKYMLKVDDDSLVIPNNLLDYCLKTNATTISGYMYQKPDVIRGKHKWAISSADYQQKYYPAYIGGPYLIPGRHCLGLYETAVSKYLPALPFEDAYVTGILAHSLGVRREKLKSLVFLQTDCNPLSLDLCHYKFVTIFWQNLKASSLRQLWRLYRETDVCSSWTSSGLRCA